MAQLDFIASFIFAAVLAGTPLLFGTLGEIITERAGNLNLGVEGMMYIGAAFSFLAGYISHDPIVFFITGFLAGVISALIYAFLTVTLRANQNVTGLTLTIFGTGLANFIGETILTSSKTNTAVLDDKIVKAFSSVNIPHLSDIPILGRLLFQYNIFVYIGIIISIIAGVYLYNTRRGLNLRAVGENPAAADASGINVDLYKYIHILLGGGICGLGGAYVIVVTCGGSWTANSVSGLGWIAVALVIFASWNPYKAILGSFAFGALRVVRFYIPNSVIDIPTAFYSALPFIVTALVIVVTSITNSKKNAQPKSCGENYFREER